jgi:hypothetical protein
MQTTEYNVDMIARRCSKETPEMILQILNEVQNIVYSQNCLQTTRITSTGMPPTITTQRGVFEYDAPAECRVTSAIFTSSLPRIFNRQKPVGPRREYYFRNKGYYLLSAETRYPTPNDPIGKIYFQEDPGDTTDQYYHLYHIRPAQLTSIDVQLTLPDEVHYLLREAVVSMITSDEYGKSNFDEAVFQKVAKKIRNSLNFGYFGNYGKTPLQEEFQEHSNEYGYRGYL